MTRSLLPEASGAITRLLLLCPSFAVDGFADPLRDFLARRPPAALTILAHRAAASTVRAWAPDADVLEVDDDTPLAMWAQDAFLVAAGPLLLRPAGRPSVVADLLGLPTVDVPLRLQGGNVLVGDDFVLVGADCARRHGSGLAAAFREHVDARRALHVVGARVPIPAETARPARSGDETWRDVRHWRCRAGTTQPLFHLDLFVSLAGGRRVLVGDPGLAARLCGHTPRPHAMQDAFDDIAAQLAALGFDVIRNPLPLLYMDEADVRERKWYFASSNNVIVSDGTVWLPTFGHGDWPELAATDDANETAWRGLGFDVVRLGDGRALAENLGGPHCLVKCLARAVDSPA